jgi:hypothetical protein
MDEKLRDAIVAALNERTTLWLGSHFGTQDVQIHRHAAGDRALAVITSYTPHQVHKFEIRISEVN